MALPKRRHSRSRQGKRRAHDHLHETGVSVCPHCNQTNQPHRICSNCGYYKGRRVVAKETA